MTVIPGQSRRTAFGLTRPADWWWTIWAAMAVWNLMMFAAAHDFDRLIIGVLWTLIVFHEFHTATYIALTDALLKEVERLEGRR